MDGVLVMAEPLTILLCQWPLLSNFKWKCTVPLRVVTPFTYGWILVLQLNGVWLALVETHGTGKNTVAPFLCLLAVTLFTSVIENNILSFKQSDLEIYSIHRRIGTN